MAEPITLTGITWNHTRGYLPLVATAQRWLDRNPGVKIEWQRRSLQEFADFPIEKLAERFDLVIIDHPFAGYAGAHPVLVPLDEHLPADYLADQEANSVGPSYRSYLDNGHLWALPVDAATPCASWRPDLLERQGVTVPQTWKELLELADRGLVAVPGIPVDSGMNFYMLCIAHGEEPGTSRERLVSEEVGVSALASLHDLLRRCDPACFDRNPIRTYEAMTQGDAIAYCPFAYPYANYSRADYVQPVLHFGGLVEFRGKRLRSTLGGTGLAVSQHSKNIEAAVAYAAEVASPDCQRGMYTVSGGQPGHRAAWLDDGCNALTAGFFRNTLQAHDESYLRPRHSGYIPFQDRLGEIVRHAVMAGGGYREAIAEIDVAWRGSFS